MTCGVVVVMGKNGVDGSNGRGACRGGGGGGGGRNGNLVMIAMVVVIAEGVFMVVACQ